MRKYDSFRIGALEIVKKVYGDGVASELTSALQNEKWTVEFRIADFPRKNGQHNIPFFSKISLRDEAHNIRAMGFDVGIGFITLTKIRQAMATAKTS